ncbi:restriction endonuclease subunit S [Ligilactobacillus salivarius]|uniref:Restriction endonuclease subunit S n=1 Tax=Ligilactobacillus salivarius TaxID=1624 RepID=A0ABD7YWU3_9LACO|nr:restriction endonuclease subunit S [Ligilactobacillus salivarius]WHS06735.1 restriction endonuclease subunit S [Ligilactobacillus salivarius]WHS08859.1 restriction endonuclease subunit S [Ligilactobacillus salivarius]WHS18462.1 restriction endonuclease subunit S [Ligilactobacillus salivarius]WHS19939.1 restriction endonuclease subunit S [Ligilactobacillus salivarius]WNB33613.1 restriction endonuclease subunit S [Ligilactobacillus salivarius]
MYIGNIIIPIKIILLNHFFYDIWEHVKSRYLFKNISSKGFQNLPVLSVTQDKGVIYRDSLDIDIKYDSSTLKNYKLVQPGDFIISLRSFQGGFETSYLTGITSPAYTIFNFIDNQSQNHMFWQYLFKRKNFINSLKKVTFGIRDGKAISFSQFGDVKVEYPDFGEQKHIAITLNKIDDAIQLHERKCEELALIKKALLQKLFPKKDEIKPEVRYENFSDAWEQRKLGEVVEMFNGDRGYNYPKDSELISEGIPFINAGDLKNGQIDLKNCKKISREKFNQLSGAKIRQGDILYCLRGTLGKNAIVKFNEGTVASSLVDIRPKTINGIYLFIILNSDIEYRQRILNDEGAAQPNLSVRNLAKFIIPVPKTKEQQKIGDFFNQIDTLITLHQCKLKKLRQLKKFLLQNMFI